MKKVCLPKRMQTVLLLLGLFLSGLAYGNNEAPYTNLLLGDSIKTGKSLIVQDTIFFNPSLRPTVLRTNMVSNVISLKIGNSSLQALPDSFKVDVTVRIIYIDKNDIQDSIVSKTLSVDYYKNRGYKSKDIFILSDAYSVEVKVLDVVVTHAPDSTVMHALELENRLQIDRDYIMNPVSGSTMNCTTNAVQTIDKDINFITTDGELKVFWPGNMAVEKYDLEWTYIDSSALANGRYNVGGNLSAQLIFKNNATRISTTANEYNIPLLYDGSGTLFFRVRGTQEDNNGEVITTAWSSNYTNGLGQYEYKGHERRLNWQASTTFAEEAKRKSVVQYFDGGLRNRQTVTKDNTSGTAVVAETLYDQQGRPMIQVLPAPTLSKLIAYNPLFNVADINSREYDKGIYDTLTSLADYCADGAPAMNPVSGTALYYSASNPQKNLAFNQYIPESNGYVFTETRYAQDNTGRINMQSGVGATHQIGSGRETKYYYGTPEQTDLDALFGTEAGEASHYQKNMVRDANGQYSVSYVDMHGRTVATALAGDSIQGITRLSSYRDSIQTEYLLNNTNNIVSGNSITASKGLLVTKAGNHTFNYNLAADSLSLEDCKEQNICYDCLYDLEITITDDCNNQLLGGAPVVIRKSNFKMYEIDTTCNMVVPVDTSFVRWLEPGSYNITKKLTISEYGMQYYRDSLFLPHNTCKTYEDFLEEQKAIVRAEMNCESEPESIQYEYQSYRREMEMDMYPLVGQYASYEADRNCYSIFNQVENSYRKSTLNYVDEEGQPALVMSRAGQLVKPQALTVEEFIENFQRSWAKALIQLHPEYKLLEAYEAYATSLQWDKDFTETETYEEAIANGYLNPTGNTTTAPASGFPNVTPDPLFSGYAISNTAKTAIQASLFTYKNISSPNTNLSLWGFATGLAKCEGNGLDTLDRSCIIEWNSTGKPFNNSLLCTGELDMAWKMFRSQYQTIKHNWLINYIKSSNTNVILHADCFRHFNTANELLTNAGFTQTSTDKAKVEAELLQTYEDNCKAYATRWWTQLQQGCHTYTAADSAIVINYLVNVCKEGSDAERPLGSSTVKPGSTYRFKSFEEVIQFYNDSTGRVTDINCNGLLLDKPLPYEQSVLVVEKVIVQKPEACECEKVEEYYQKYVPRRNEYSNFSAFMAQVYQVKIAQPALDSLRSLCSGEISCNYISKPLPLPVVFQCGSVSEACVECDVVKNLYDSFSVKFPTVVPRLEETDTTQQKINQVFATYLNHRLGFTKTTQEYLQFMEECDSARLTLNCADTSLTRILLEYNKLFEGVSVNELKNNIIALPQGKDVASQNLPFGASDPHYQFSRDRQSWQDAIVKNHPWHSGNPVDPYWIGTEDLGEIGTVFFRTKIFVTPTALNQVYNYIRVDEFINKIYVNGVKIAQHGTATPVINDGVNHLSGLKPGWNDIEWELINTTGYLAFNTLFYSEASATFDCRESFKDYFNQQKGTAYQYSQIDSLYGSSCEEPLREKLICFNNTVCDSFSVLIESFKEIRKPLIQGKILQNKQITHCAEEIVKGLNALIETRLNPLNPQLSGTFCYDPSINANLALLHAVKRRGAFATDSTYSVCLPLSLGCSQEDLAPLVPSLMNNEVLASDFCDPNIDTSYLSKKYYSVSMSDKWGGGHILWTYQYGNEFASDLIPHYKYLPPPPGVRDNHSEVVWLLKIPDSIQTYNQYIANRLNFPLVGLGELKSIKDLRFDTRFLPDNYEQTNDIRTAAFLQATVEYRDGSRGLVHLRNNYEGSVYLQFKHIIDTSLYQSDCREAFAYYYNQENGTSYSYNQVDSLYQANCGRSLEVCNECKDMEAELDAYYKEYIDPASGYVDLKMRTFAGNLTPAEGPKGVFDVNGKLIGNTVDGTPAQINESYVSIWNSDSTNAVVGTLQLLPDSVFRLYLKPGQKAPCNGIVGQRFYQFETNVLNQLAPQILTAEGSYVHFGDGDAHYFTRANIENLYYSHTDDPTTTVSQNNVRWQWGENTYFLQNYTPLKDFSLRHTYPKTSGVWQQYTVTVYHTELKGVVGFKWGGRTNISDPATTGFANLRGYFPQQTLKIFFSGIQDSTMARTSQVKNFNQITSIESVEIRSDNGFVPRHLNLGSFAKNKNLKFLWYQTDSDTTGKSFNEIFPKMNINFPNLNFLMIIARNTGRHSFDSLSFELPRLRSIDMFALDSLFARNFDSIINQLARVNNELNGTGRIGWSGTYKEAPTAASLSAREKLLGQNFQIAPFGSYNGGLNVPKDIFDFEPLREDDAFTNFFNRRNATEFTFREIKRFFVERCYRELDICSYQPPVKPVSTLLLCGKQAANEPSVFNQGDPCADSTNIAIVRATELYRLYTDSLKNAFAEAYQQKCLEAANREVFTVTHPVSEYHYTLYYYDQAGNLVKTVPPEGVHPNRDLAWLNDVKVKKAAGLRKVPTHTLATTYRYNSLNQVVSQKSPDGGYSEFWYDRLGRLVVSRNAKQLAEGKYSYTLYDFLGRITEVGQKKQVTAMTQAIARDPAALYDWLRYYYTPPGESTSIAEQVTATFYDHPDYSALLTTPIPVRQRAYTLRNRVSYTRVYDYLGFSLRGSGSPIYSDYNQATTYCYDIHGNVDTLLQDYRTGIMAANGDNRFKVMTYKYDLISGKVNQVHYQPGQRDQLYHRYEYDAENRITDVYTSNHKLMIGNTHLEEHEAFYQYYKHGPLARTVLGQEQVQGIDYAYTLQGWLKGVNSDTLLDSDANALVDGGANRYVGRDAFRFSLNYYNGEYQPIGAAVQGVFPGHSAYMGSEYRPLYNGNISSMVVDIPKLGDTKLYNYQYDQLNRLVKMDMWQGYDVSNGWSGITKTNDYKEEISYDANGNILTYLRNGNPSAGKPVVMDQLTYQYNKDVNQRLANNKLRHVQDAIGNNNYLTDIDNQADDNYIYDPIGNLIADQAENITEISWNVYGKIIQISKAETPANKIETIRYGYDVAGNRVSKWVKKFGGESGKYTQYVRDASGNVMAIYTGNGTEETPATGLQLTEHHLYGSSRIGIWNKDVDMTVTETPGTTLSLNFERGNKFFELSNHLGNVLAVISDKKLAVDTDNDGIVDYYEADVVNAADYAPFGMQLPGRVFPEMVIPEVNPTGITMPTGSGYHEGAAADVITAAHNSFTIELWVNPTSTHEIDTESQSGGAGTTGQKYVIDAMNGDHITVASNATAPGISVGTNGVSVYEHGPGFMYCLLAWEGTVDGWTHIAVVYNNKIPHLYVNGVLVKTGLASPLTNIYASNLVGRGYYGSMDGQFDEVRVWSTARTQQQIAGNMNGTVAAPQPDLAAYWPVKAGETTSLEDMSGNGYDVVLNTAYSGSNFTASTAMQVVGQGGYRYGFNGKENDNEVKGEGNQQDYGMRIYDNRLGRFLSVDPITKEYPELTPYQFASNTPIWAIDLDGLEGFVPTGMPNVHSKSNRPMGMIVTVEEAATINKNIVVGSFKAVFSESLPKKLIDHYVNGKGSTYKLSNDEVNSLNVAKTGMKGLVQADHNKFAELTSSIGKRDKGKKHIIHVDNYSIQGGANVGGTLGRFTIEIQGELVYDKDDKTKWTFEGKMRYFDRYDFETNEVGSDDLQRSSWGDFQTKFAQKFLPGQGFEVISDWIDVKQTSKDSYFDFYKGKSSESKQNKVSNEIQRSTENGKDNAVPSEIKETKTRG